VQAGRNGTKDLPICIQTVCRWSRSYQLRALAGERRRFGYRRLHILLVREGIRLNHKRPFQLYREERLGVGQRGGRKRALGTRSPRALP
jgi:putative transposase